MSSANKQTALAAHRAPCKRPFHGRFRRPEPRVFWAFQRGADFSLSPIYLEFSAPHRFTFPACPDSSVFPACIASSTQHCFVFPAHPELSALHRASRKRPFHLHSRRPEPRVFWASPACPSFFASPLCPESFTFPACLEFSASSAHPERSAPRQSSRKRPFRLRFRRPEARVFWAFQRGTDFSALTAHRAPDASGALFRRAVLRGERPGLDQPFGAHAS